VATLLVGIGVWMVVAGWPMETPAQLVLMDLAQLPMAAAVLVAIVEMTYGRRLWVGSPRRFVTVFGPGAGLVLAGLVMMVVAFVAPARHLVGTAHLLVWTGLGIAFVYLAVDSVQRDIRGSRPALQPVDADEYDELLSDDDELWDDPDDDAANVDAPPPSHRARQLLDEGPAPDDGTARPA